MDNIKAAIKEFLRKIDELNKNRKEIDYQKLNSIKKELSKKYKLKNVLTNIKILTYLTSKDKKYNKYFITKPTRTISGVAVVAVMSYPYPCPHGKCIYCPGGIKSVFGNVPQSYTGKEPATMRGIRNNYDSYMQIFNRLEQYIVLGQNPEKIELIIMGGTFLSFPDKYKNDFIMNCFKAMNDFSDIFFEKNKIDIKKFNDFFELPGDVNDENRTRKIQQKIIKLKLNNIKNILYEQKRNENSKIKCVGLTIETRPDYGKLKQGNELLKYGCTRVELGIQTIYDEVLKKISRGHSIKDSIESIRTLKDLGFKLNFHMMPGLPRISKQKDIDSLKKLFSDENFKPDMLKIYPCMVMPGTKLEEEYKKGKYKPLKTKEAAEIIFELKKIIPKYCRIMRIQRDIPTKFAVAGVDRNNLRQYVDELMKKENAKCNCIRCREIKNESIRGKIKFEIIEYNASRGKEFFISLVDNADKLIGFCRLRFPSLFLRKEITKESALLRELHVFGSATQLGKKGNIQHRGFGKILLKKAEDIAKKHRKNKIIVISGIGVRNYYKNLGYKLEDVYMVKRI